jgi:NAD-dependent deacetylase
MKKIILFSGAGMSAESGLKTFRDNNGLWENYRVEDVATPEAWQADPELVLQFYCSKKETAFKCHS